MNNVIGESVCPWISYEDRVRTYRRKRREGEGPCSIQSWLSGLESAARCATSVLSLEHARTRVYIELVFLFRFVPKTCRADIQKSRSIWPKSGETKLNNRKRNWAIFRSELLPTLDQSIRCHSSTITILSSINDIPFWIPWFFNESAGDCFNETEATQTNPVSFVLPVSISPKYGVSWPCPSVSLHRDKLRAMGLVVSA